MTLSDRIFKPFETLIKPLDLPITTIPDKGPVSVVWHFAKMFKGVLVAVAILSIASALFSILLVWSLAYVVDGVVESGAGQFVSDNFVLLIVLAVLIVVVDPVLSFIKGAFSQQTAGTLMPAAMRWQSHKSVEKQDVEFFEDTYAGQVASRIEQVTGSVQQQMFLVVQQIPAMSIEFVGSIVLLLYLAWQLALPVLGWIVLNVLLAVWAVPSFIKRSSRVAEASSRATGVMTDVYGNIPLVKAYSAEETESDSIRKVINDTIDTRHAETRQYVVYETGMRFINALLAISIFIIGIVGMIREFVSVGDFVAAVTVTRALIGSSYAFLGLGYSVSQTLGTIRDAMPVLTAEPSVFDKRDATPFTIGDGEIIFDDVCYAYNSTASEKGDAEQLEESQLEGQPEEKQPAPLVINNFSLHIEPNEKVGLVGVSGAGKSTLIALLLRLRDVDSGSIRVDKQDVRDVVQMTLRKEIGVISQDAFLLNRSVRDNVKYGAPDACDESIIKALDLAEALEFVEGMCDKEDRKGLDAMVGDKGVKLSGGQRQRLAIARVILKDAKILLLDEATSALDSKAEAEIQNNLKRVMQNKTTLVIAHRLSTIAEMDRLIVIDNGTIKEQGTHAELVKANGLYQKLWDRQSGGFLGTEISALDSGSR